MMWLERRVFGLWVTLQAYLSRNFSLWNCFAFRRLRQLHMLCCWWRGWRVFDRLLRGQFPHPHPQRRRDPSSLFISVSWTSLLRTPLLNLKVYLHHCRGKYICYAFSYSLPMYQVKFLVHPVQLTLTVKSRRMLGLAVLRNTRATQTVPLPSFVNSLVRFPSPGDVKKVSAWLRHGAMQCRPDLWWGQGRRQDTGDTENQVNSSACCRMPLGPEALRAWQCASACECLGTFALARLCVWIQPHGYSALCWFF